MEERFEDRGELEMGATGSRSPKGRPRFSVALTFAVPGVALAMSLISVAAIKPVFATYQPWVAAVARSPLEHRLQQRGARVGDPVFIRIFKGEAILEVWLRSKPNEPFRLFESYPICAMSGGLGPKTKQGDRQAPEGFYTVGLSQLNPHSSYHLSFNIGYPNAFERAKGYTGDYIMVHGDCVSAGCFAMTDAGIDEIYAFVEAALKNGQKTVPVHIFPFRLTEEALSREAESDWIDFWRTLKGPFDVFEKTGSPPVVLIRDGRYTLGE